MIYNEDCLEGMKRIADGSVDMILTDLPYGTTDCAFDKRIPFEPMWEQFKRVTKRLQKSLDESDSLKMQI